MSSEQQVPPLPPPADPRLLTVLVSVGYVAAVIAAWGLISLVLDVDVISEKRAGPLLGPSMVLCAAIVVFLSLWTLRNWRSLVGPALGATASVYLVMLVIGAIGYSYTQRDVTWLVLFTARYATSPFVIAAALLGGLSVVFLWAVTFRSRRDKRA